MVKEATATDRDADEAIRDAEKIIIEARQRYPGASHITTLEARLAHVLEDDSRTYSALAKAHKANQRDPFITTSVAVILLRQGQFSEAELVVSEALATNRNDKRLNYMYAEIERKLGQIEK